MTTEPTVSLLHYNGCSADSGAPCTCEPPLTTVEDVTALLFACHVLEYIDADTGWACGCDEDGYLELPTLQDAHKHQAEAALKDLAPLIKAQALAEVAHLQERLDTAEGRLAPFAAQHRPCKNMFRTCVTCRDGYGEPLPWPCKDASRLDLVGNCTECGAPTLRGSDQTCPTCDADLGSEVSR